ncbi:MAG: DNA cytosine methyltransferase [Treponema sp.]|nr:DNA cytosine methyltransferase [Treponema sp.]
MRVKVPTAAPALVAMVQTSVIGRLKRKMSLKECLRLQDFPDDFSFGLTDRPQKKHYAQDCNHRISLRI